MDLAPYFPASPIGATAPEIATAVLREAILDGAIPASDPLPQDLIAGRLGISKIPVREALRSLEAEGLVRFVPNRGAIVAPLSVQELGEIVEMRVALEPMALRLAIPHLTDADLRRAISLVVDLDEAGDPAIQSRLNWNLHATLYSRAGRGLLLSTIRGLHTRVDRYMRVVLSDARHHRESQREHRALIKACRNRDVEAATTILREHVERHTADAEALLAAHQARRAGTPGRT